MRASNPLVISVKAESSPQRHQPIIHFDVLLNAKNNMDPGFRRDDDAQGCVP
jgi:hypothetical protein